VICDEYCQNLLIKYILSVYSSTLLIIKEFRMFKSLPAYTNSKSLSVKKLSIEKQDHWLFQNVNFELKPKEVLHLEGENGSGKTTLLRALCGLTIADEGEIFWDGASIQKQSYDYHLQLSYVGHSDGIKQDLTVLENLRVAMVLSRSIYKVSDKKILSDILKSIGLENKEDTLAFHLSAGQRRRLAFARCLLNDSALWILDEPLTALDVKGVAFIEQAIQAHIERGGLAIITSHQPLNVKNVRCTRLNLSAVA